MATSPDVTLRTACLTAAFCSASVALYGVVAIGPAPLVALFVSSAP